MKKTADQVPASAWVEYHLGYLAYTLMLVTGFMLNLYLIKHDYVAIIILASALIPIAYDAWGDLVERTLSTEFFLVLATVIALIAGQQESITVVLLIMLVAKYLEKFIEGRTERAVESLLKLVPRDVVIKDGVREYSASLDDVSLGMLIVVKTGSQIPVDGIVVSGQASINESFLTGESIPREKGVADRVFAGTFLEAGSLVIKVQQVGSETYFGKISKLMEAAEKEKAKIISVSNKAALIIMYGLGIFITGVWIFTQDLTLVATLLVFGSPIELTLITPLAIIAGTAAAFRSGILVKGSIALERLASVDTLIFDKTGTLTVGEPKVIAIESASADYSEDKILQLAAILEKRSGHVIAKAILDHAHAKGISIDDPTDYESISGHGIQAMYQGTRYMLGSEHFISAPEHGNLPIPQALMSHTAGSATSFYLSTEKVVCGRILLADTIRSEAKDTIQKLKDSGIQEIILLSGDRQEVAHHIGGQLGIEKVYGEVAPDEKLHVIKERQSKGHTVAMIGDGINDAPALKQADVGIAMGAMGMEPAIDAADIVLMANNLQGVIFVRVLSRKIMSVIIQNIFLGFALIHLLGIVLAMFHLVTPIQAALFHAVSDLLVLLNSARLVTFSLDV